MNLGPIQIHVNIFQHLSTYHILYIYCIYYITYLPHKAVAEVSKDKEPIGRECAEFNWFESQLMSDSNELRIKWFGCHLIWDSNDFGCQLIWDSIDLVVNWFEIQMIWLSIDVCFKWFWLSVDSNFKWCGCQLIWGSSDLVVNWCVIQMILSNEAFLRDFLQKRSFEDQKRSFSARLPSKSKLWSSKTKLFCESSFKIEAMKLKNEAFLRDLFQKWSFGAQKRSFSASLPSNMKLWSSKTKLFCESSFKIETMKLKNEAFLRDLFQKWSFGAQKRSFSARLPSKMTSWPDTWPQISNKF